MPTQSASLNNDALTGALSRAQLEYDLTNELFHAGRSGQHYVNSFLCLDIENFRTYLDYNGFAASDSVLVALADRLRSQYPGHKVYRFGGDEFVVAGAKTMEPGVSSGLPVRVKHAIVSVNTAVQKGRHHRAKSWVLLFIPVLCAQASVAWSSHAASVSNVRPDTSMALSMKRAKRGNKRGMLAHSRRT